MKSSAAVCVVVPTLGTRMDWLASAVESVTLQSVEARVVVVGPQDRNDARVLVERLGATWLDERKRGIGAAINQGWEGASEPYLAWLGDDDLLHKGSLAHATRALDRSPEAAMVYGRLRCVDSNGGTLFTIAPGRFGATWMRFGHDFVPQPGSLFRREAVEQVGGVNEELRYAMDLDLFLRLRQVGKLRYLSRSLASFRRHETSLTVANPKPGSEARQVRRTYLGQVGRRLESFAFPVVDRLGKLWAVAFRLDPRHSATEDAT